MNNSETRFVQRARELYHAAAHHIDPLTSAQLRAARARALATAQARESGLGTRWLVPGGAVAVALAAVLLWQPMTHVTQSAGAAGSSTIYNHDMDSELPPDAEQTDPALYQNLDFYGWLAANDRSAGNR